VADEDLKQVTALSIEYDFFTILSQMENLEYLSYHVPVQDWSF